MALTAEQKRAMRNKCQEIISSLSALQYKRFAMIENHVGMIDQWPAHMLHDIVGDHLNHHQRWSCTLFMLANQCPPDLWAEWLLTRGMLKDQSARFHVASLIADHQDSKLAKYSTYMLPFRCTVITVPPADQKHRWDGVGDPCSGDKHSYIFPVYTPTFADPTSPYSMHTMWWKAINMLKLNNIRAPPIPRTMQSTEAQVQVQIVPLEDESETVPPLSPEIA